MSPRFSTLLIGNRGEIACRVIRAARAEGLRTVAVYSDADIDALHVREADQAVRIGPARPSQSYLDVEALISAAKTASADAIHPGYGFLSERAEFAQRCADAGLIFVGPPPAAMRAMGDKSAAKLRMIEAGVPCALGYQGEDQSTARLVSEAARTGYPVMIKASAGGGGRGMRLVNDPADLEAALRSAHAEAESAFGDGRLLIERAILGARHVEIQVFGDEHGHIVHLGERDCSIQRRHQKLIEESPSPAVSPELRERMGAAAVRAAAAVGYVGAGTVEFLLDANGEFYFLEMNTRIQVEHPVTEAVTGLDLVRLQLHVAQGRPLPFSQSDIVLSGHAIEARLCAEDANANFAPVTGDIVGWRPFSGDGVRIDHGLAEGGAVSPYYDSLLAKVIAQGVTREEARLRLLRALENTLLAGIVSNRDFLIEMLRHPDFAAGEANTGFIAAMGPRPAPTPTREALALAALLFVENGGPVAPSPSWRRAPLKLACGGTTFVLSIRRAGANWLVEDEQGATRLTLVRRDETSLRFASEGRERAAIYVRWGDRLKLDLDGAGWDFTDVTYAPPRPEDEEADAFVRSPVSGVIMAVEATEGERVRRGQALATVEAMKMQYAILAPIAGTLVAAPARAGAQIPARGLLFEISPGDE